MAGNSAIEWTDAVWNPTTGCTRVSPGCKNCYAFQLHDMRHEAFKAGKKLPQQYAKPFKELQLFEDRVTTPLKWKKPKRIFVNSMSDLFHKDVPDEFLHRVFHTMEAAHWHTFQILTKRPERMKEYMGWRWGEGRIPSRHIWLGTSVERQEEADERIPHLLRTPAAVRFLSCEPLLGKVNLRPYLPHKFNREPTCEWCEDCIPNTPGMEWWKQTRADNHSPFIDWCIVGGESGRAPRPCDLAWLRSLTVQCKAASVPMFVKQLGSNATASYYDEFREEWESQRGNDWPAALDWNHRDGQPPLTARVALPLAKKGGDFDEFPAALRIREFPEGHA